MTLKKRLFLVGILLTLAGLFSCVFDETEDAKSWMAHEGVPVSTKIDMVVLNGVKPDSLWIVRDTVPYVNGYTISLGEVNGVRQEMVMDLLTHDADSVALGWLQDGDSSWVSLLVNLDSVYHATMPQGDSLPFSEAMKVRFAWKLHTEMDGDAIDSLVLGNDEMDTLLMKVMSGEVQWDTASIPLVVSFSKVGRATTIPLPGQLQTAFQKAKKGNFYLQLKVAFDQAERVYRLSGDNSKTTWRPRLSFNRVKNDSTQSYSGLIDSVNVYSRYFQIGYVNENATASQLALHGGAPESLYVDFPEDLVFSEIQRQLQDRFALRDDQIDSLLTDRFVLLASMDLASDKDKKHSELGHPLLVYSYSVVDTIAAAGVIGFTEEYNSNHEPRTLIDSLNVVTKGRSNTLFWAKRDSVQMQITNAVRYWLQSKNYGAHLRTKMAVSAWPIFEPDRYSTSSYYDADSNEVDVVSSYSANSRWSLGNSDSLTFRIRMWLTEKR